MTSTNNCIVRDRLDALEILVAEKRPPWYKQVGTLLSVAALIVSSVTAYVSFRFQSATEIRAEKQVLQDTISSLLDLNSDATKIESDKTLLPDEKGRQMLVLGDKVGVLIEEAQNSIEQLPSRYPTSAEFGILAMASIQLGDPARGINYLNNAIKAAKTFTDLQTSTRNLAIFYTEPGPFDNINKAQILFEQAVNVATPTDPLDIMQLAETFALFGIAQTRNGSPTEGKVKLEQAETLCKKIPPDNPLQSVCIQSLNHSPGVPASAMTRPLFP